MKLLHRSMSCRKVAKVLQSYLDGEVSAPTREAVAEHLELCRDCGLEADTYLAIKAALHDSGDRLRPVDAAALDRLRAFAARVRDDDDQSKTD